MASSVFTKFEIYHKTRGGTLVAWEINRMFNLPAPWSFQLMASRSGVGDWVLVATAVDTFVAEDLNQWVYGKAPRLFYKVVLTTGDSQEFESCTKQILSNLSDHDLQVVNEILRKEDLNNMGYAGQCGYLYKRRIWGTKCPVCLDYDSEEVKKSHCTTCFGTGFTGGYFSPVCYWVKPSTAGISRRKTTVPEGQSIIHDRVWPVRGINCPWLDTGDIWVDFDNDRRYVVQSVQEVLYRSTPIIFDPIELRLAPSTDIIYNLVRPDDQSSM
jgi:hypothetical protein